MRTTARAAVACLAGSLAVAGVGAHSAATSICPVGRCRRSEAPRVRRTRKSQSQFHAQGSERSRREVVGLPRQSAAARFLGDLVRPVQSRNPRLVDLTKTYKAKGFEVIGVVAMDEFTKAKPFVQQYGINYTVLNGVDREDIEDAFGPLFALPTCR